ncbi:MAG: hypothetical protein GF308_01220 [Candidatus Heimdallarchaeota archaeon]|nr:hypothetical protein [Candidatus Heimdallarchaeota archaeon]
MFFRRRQRKKTKNQFKHLLDEAIILFQTIILQQSGTNAEKFKVLPIKKASIDNLSDCLITVKNYTKKNQDTLQKYIQVLRDECINDLKQDEDLSHIVLELMKRNLIADNNDIALYLAPYADNWNLFSNAVQFLILNHIIKSINRDRQKSKISSMIENNILPQNG